MMTLIIACMAFTGYMTYYYLKFIKDEKRVVPEIRYLEKKYKIRLKKCEKNLLKRRIGGYYALTIAITILVCLDIANIYLAMLSAFILCMLFLLFGVFLLNRYGMKQKFLRAQKRKTKSKKKDKVSK